MKLNLADFLLSTFLRTEINFKLQLTRGKKLRQWRVWELLRGFSFWVLLIQFIKLHNFSIFKVRAVHKRRHAFCTPPPPCVMWETKKSVRHSSLTPPPPPLKNMTSFVYSLLRDQEFSFLISLSIQQQLKLWIVFDNLFDCLQLLLHLCQSFQEHFFVFKNFQA